MENLKFGKLWIWKFPKLSKFCGIVLESEKVAPYENSEDYVESFHYLEVKAAALKKNK